jgi:UDP-glucuronate 4-epimerase
MKILVTGAAGFIGFHLSRHLLNRGDEVVGIDNLNDYYDVSLKKDRLAQLQENPNFRFYKLDIADYDSITQLFSEQQFDIVVNLAAQAGVRYSLKNPRAYVDSNLVGFVNILEGCRHSNVKHLVFASSSSVYGANTKIPFSVHDNVDHPISFYAATKKANELMAHSYSHSYSLPTTGLRFFTVYGPWGRPDMALFLFTKAILAGQPIDIFNYGKMRRDFTYIDDVIEGIIRIMDTIPGPDPNWSGQAPDPRASMAPYKLYNVGNHQPVDLMYLIELLESHLGMKAIKNLLPIQSSEVPVTYADIEDLENIGFKPNTPIEIGVERFIAWYYFYFQSHCKN